MSNYKLVLMCHNDPDPEHPEVKRERRSAEVNNVVLSMYSDILKCHNELKHMTFKCNQKTTIQSYINNHTLTLKKHKDFMKACRFVQTNASLRNRYFAKFHNRLVLDAISERQTIYRLLHEIFQYTQVEHIYEEFVNKLEEVRLMHNSIDKCL